MRLWSAVVVAVLLSSCQGSGLPIASRSASPSSYFPSVQATGFQSSTGIDRYRLDFAPYAVGAGDGEVWVAGAHAVQRFAAATGRALGSSLEICETLLSGTVRNGHLWAVGGGDCRNPQRGLLEIGAHGVLRRIDIGGEGYDVVFAWERFWVVNTGQTVTVVDPVTQSVERTPVAGEFLNAVTKGAGSIWALSSGSGGRSFTAIDPVSLGVGPQHPAGKCPIDIVVRGSSVWVADYCRDVVRRFSTSGRLREVVRVGNKPTALLLVGKELWVANAGARSVMRIALTEGNAISEYAVGGRPRGLALVHGTIWVANPTDVESVTRIEK